MKNIEPFNSDIEPGEKPVAAVPVEPTPEPQSIPAQPPAPVINDRAPAGITAQNSSDPAVASVQASQAIYPELLSVDEKRYGQGQTPPDEGGAPGFSLSRILIPGIVGLYAIYSVVKTLQSVFAESSYALSYVLGPGGAFLSYLWLGIIFGLSLLIMAIIVSYKIFRGSKLALALLTGPLVIYLQYKLVLYIAALTSFGQSLGSAAVIAQLLAEIIVAVMLVLAWTKDKKHYS